MRIGDDYYSVTPDGCSDAYYGQYKDYAVTIRLVTTGIKEYAEAANSFVLFPNPAGNHLNIVPADNKESNLQVEINDVVGKLVYKQNIHPAQNATGFDINLPNGIYLQK